MASHANLSPSAASRWMGCPGSIALCKTVEREWSEHAALGSAAHLLAERCLTHGEQAATHLGVTITAQGSKFLVDADMTRAVQVYLDKVRSFLTFGGELAVEVKGSLAPAIPDIWGTADARIYLPMNQELIVGDYKHGQGVLVEAENNPQLMIYACIAMMEFPHPVQRVTLMVVQPRCASGAPVRSWSLSRDELAAWFKGPLMAAAEKARHPDAPLIPDRNVPGYCRFCDARHVCPAKVEQANALAAQAFGGAPPNVMRGPGGLIPPEQMSAQQLAAALDLKAMIDEWFTKVGTYAKDKALRGEDVPGRKLVRGRRSRFWTDQSEAEAKLKRKGIDPYKKTLLTPPQVRDHLKELGYTGDQINEFMKGIESWSTPGLCLASASDNRKAVEPPQDAATVFTPANPFA